MKNSKSIKKALKQKGLWKKYKIKFAHKQMRLVLTNLFLVFSNENETEKLLESEMKLIDVKKGPDMFVESFSILDKILDRKFDSKSLAKLMWYQYQTSTYWKDSKKKIPNIFSEKTYIKMNSIKRDYYLKFTESFDKSDPKYNKYLIDVLRRIS